MRNNNKEMNHDGKEHSTKSTNSNTPNHSSSQSPMKLSFGSSEKRNQPNQQQNNQLPNNTSDQPLDDTNKFSEEHELYRNVPAPLPPEVLKNEEDFKDTNIETDLESLIKKLQSELSEPGSTTKRTNTSTPTNTNSTTQTTTATQNQKQHQTETKNDDEEEEEDEESENEEEESEMKLTQKIKMTSITITSTPIKLKKHHNQYLQNNGLLF